MNRVIISVLNTLWQYIFIGFWATNNVCLQMQAVSLCCFLSWTVEWDNIVYQLWCICSWNVVFEGDRSLSLYTLFHLAVLTCCLLCSAKSMETCFNGVQAVCEAAGMMLNLYQLIINPHRGGGDDVVNLNLFTALKSWQRPYKTFYIWIQLQHILLYIVFIYFSKYCLWCYWYICVLFTCCTEVSIKVSYFVYWL